ncbi:MAG: class I SAM-dependent methyltransferase [Syntrophales bacterium]
MQTKSDYLMENSEEALRLSQKTDPDAVRKQAAWCGIKAGLRVLDFGCGPGVTTDIFREMVQPGGSVVGVDISEERIAGAISSYSGKAGVSFFVGDIRKPTNDIGTFDIIWVRFVLEYYRKESKEIVNNLKNILNPGGWLCLLDLDYNCLNHYELPGPMKDLLPRLMAFLDERYNFDTFSGQKLYSYLFDGQYENLQVEMIAHHLIYGNARESDIFNWTKKIEVTADRLQPLFMDYPGGIEQFKDDFRRFFVDPRRFTYTPLIMCKGMKPYGN